MHFPCLDETRPDAWPLGTSPAGDATRRHCRATPDQQRRLTHAALIGGTRLAQQQRNSARPAAARAKPHATTRPPIVSGVVDAVGFDRARARVVASDRSRVAARVAEALLLCAVAALPFERAVASAAGFTLTTVEIALLALLTAAAFHRLSGEAGAPIWPDAIAIPGAIWLVVVAGAAVAATVEPDNALRFAARMAMAGAVCVATANIVGDRRLARRVVTVWVATASAVAIVALLEWAEIAVVLNGLTLFRPGFHVVGGQLRATSTLLYPTITSMYFEVAFALGLWLLMDAPTRLARAAVFVALAVIGTAIGATFTRAGLIGMVAALTLVATLRVVRLGRRPARVGLLAALALVIATGVSGLYSPEGLAARLGSEGSGAWYGATYRVPGVLDLQTGATTTVPIGLTNTGRLTWDSTRDPAYAMSYHWLRAGTEDVVEFDGVRTRFPSAVTPGESLTLPVIVRAPARPGTYVLVWDMVLESRAWLSTEGVPPARTRVEVTGSPIGRVETVMARLPQSPTRPPRTVLWRTALAIAGAHPILGIGPDGFRHVYGRYSGLTHVDPRVHANNMYLEMLTGAGVPGLASLLWLVGAAGLALARRCQRVPDDLLAPATAMLAAWLMVAGHGLVDSFLSFTPAYASFAIAAGLAFSPGLRGASVITRETCEGGARAHRV